LDRDQYKQEMEALERMLEEVDKRIQDIADSIADRAFLTYPNEYIDTELHPIHERLTTQADKIVNRMQKVSNAFHTQLTKTTP